MPQPANPSPIAMLGVRRTNPNAAPIPLRIEASGTCWRLVDAERSGCRARALPRVFVSPEAAKEYIQARNDELGHPRYLLVC